jgi:hypothetical protein
LTVDPNKDIINYYIKDFNDRLLEGKSANLAIFGPQQFNVNIANMSKNIKLFETIHAFKNKFLKASIFA